MGQWPNDYILVAIPYRDTDKTSLGGGMHCPAWYAETCRLLFVWCRPHLLITLSTKSTKVGQCPTWWPPCQILVAPSVQRRKVWLTPNTGLPCSNAAKTRNPLKLAGMPQTTGSISAASGPKLTILWEHVLEIMLLKEFFPIVDTCLSSEDIAREICAMGHR